MSSEIDTIWRLRLALFMHDIGKLRSYQNHEKEGAELLVKLGFDVLSILVACTHEVGTRSNARKRLRKFLSEKFSKLLMEKLASRFWYISFVADKNSALLDKPSAYLIGKRSRIELKLPLTGCSKFFIRNEDYEKNIENILRPLSRLSPKEFFDAVFKCIVDENTCDKNLFEFLLLLGKIPSDTRPPLNDHSLLEHIIITTTLGDVLWFSIDNIDKVSFDVHSQLFMVSINSSEFLVSSRRLREQRMKLEMLWDAFKDILIRLHSTTIDEYPLCPMISLIFPRISAIFTLTHFIDGVSRTELLMNLICASDNHIFLLPPIERIPIKIAETYLEVFDNYDLLEALSPKFRRIKQSYNFRKKNEIYRLYAYMLRRDLRSITKIREEDLFFFEPKSLKIKTDAAPSTLLTLCEICHRPAQIKVSRRFLCYRCAKRYKKTKLGVLIDEIAFPSNYIALIFIAIRDWYDLIFYNTTSTAYYAITYNYGTEGIEVSTPVIWSPSRAHAIASDSFNAMWQIFNAIQQSITKKLYRSLCRVELLHTVRELQEGDSLIVADTNNNKYIIMFLDIKDNEYLSLITGYQKVKPNIILESETFKGKIINIQKIEEIPGKNLVVPLLIASNEILLLLPADKLTEALEAVINKLQNFQISERIFNIKTIVVHRKYPLYLAAQRVRS